ncbi:MAG: fibronectin type III domain-containing protein [Clostridia bacterium]|nr:fibronectin type III domain-containing protein [Clostridia bacterium]
MNQTKPHRGSTPNPDHIMLSICGDAKTTMTVTWRTDCSVANGWIELRPEWGGEKDKFRVEAITRYFKSDIDESNLHTAKPTGLTPGTRYFYTVGDDTHRSEEYSLQTEPENLTHFSFIVIADEQNSDPFAAPEYRPVRNLLELALSRCPDAKFIVTLGDNVDNGENELQWNGLFHGMKGIVEHIPFMLGTGNHENRGFRVYTEENRSGKYYLAHADTFDHQFKEAYPQNGPKGYETENFSFDYGDLHFFMLGVNAFEEVGEWLQGDLAATDKTWKLGAFHYPVFPIMPEGLSGMMYGKIPDALDSGKADVLFAGHEHSLARSYPIRNYEMFDRPSEGTIHYILGNSGDNGFASNAGKVWHYNFYPQEERNSMYAQVDVTPTRLTVTSYLDDGRTVDRFTIDKTRDELDPPLAAPIYFHTHMAYKGNLMELAARNIYARPTGDTVFVPFAVVAQGIGAEVVKEPGRVTIDLYGTRVVFEEGSAEATKNGEPFALSAPTFLGDRGEIYVDANDVAAIWDLQWRYAKRNNIIDFDYIEEDFPCCMQPPRDTTGFIGFKRRFAPGENQPLPQTEQPQA